MKEYEIEISRSQRNLDMDLPGELIFGVPGPKGEPGKDGRGIVSVERTDGNGAAGTYDTYTITYTDNTTSNFKVYNGANGTDGGSAEGAVLYTAQELTEEQKAQARENIGAPADNAIVKTVNGTAPDENGNVNVSGSGGGSVDPGTHKYVGEKIQLARHTFDYKQLFNTTENGVGMQDGCAYGDYYFQLTPNGRFGVYNLRDNSFVGAFDLDRKDTIVPHCNSACFGSKFYQPTDPFPLLYTNAYNNTELPLGTCYVHRILQDGNTFSTQLVQTIQIGFTDGDLWISTDNETRPYGNFIVDGVNNFLYAYTVRDGDKITRFFKFALPEVGMVGVSAFLSMDYDPSMATANTTLNTSTGATGSSTSYWVTDYLTVGDAVGVNINTQAYRVFCYDANSDFIGYRDVENKYNDVDLIDGTAYVRVLFHKNYTTYEQASEVKIRGLLHIPSTLSYDPAESEDGKAMSGNDVSDNSNYWISGYIPTDGRTSCWFNFRPYKLGFFTAEKTFISGPYAESNTVSFPEGTAYVRVQYTRTKNTPYETAQHLVVLDAEPTGEASGAIVLTEDDIIDRFDTDHFAIPQGCECHNERLFVTSGWGDASTGSFLHIIDPKNKTEVSTINFLNILEGEPEAVTVVNNRLLYGSGGTMYELLV